MFVLIWWAFATFGADGALPEPLPVLDGFFSVFVIRYRKEGRVLRAKTRRVAESSSPKPTHLLRFAFLVVECLPVQCIWCISQQPLLLFPIRKKRKKHHSLRFAGLGLDAAV
jgi:hypothetical protein